LSRKLKGADMQNTFFIPFILIGAFIFGWVIGKMLRVNMSGRRPYREYRENLGDLNKQSQGKGGTNEASNQRR